VIRILDAADESELRSVPIIYIPPYSMRTATFLGDEPYLFHNPDREATCSGCHNLPQVFETVRDKPLTPAAKVCAACHPRVESAPNLHGPVAVYACFMCHEPEYTPSRFAQKTSQPASCGSCHEGFLARILGGKKYVHGPAAAGACIVCHDPHGGETTALVRETAPNLCLRCHADTLPLPVEKNLHGQIACTRCHDPHGGLTRVRTALGGNAFCGSCHADLAYGKMGHPLGGHPVTADADPARPGRPMECISCHGAHDPNDVSRRNIAKNVSSQQGFCRKCHY
jgi:predicted CXXCH cytochrome family protein